MVMEPDIAQAVVLFSLRGDIERRETYEDYEG